MSNFEEESDSRRSPEIIGAGDRFIYVIPSDQDGEKDISFFDLWDALWASKWLLAAITTIFGVLAGVYAFTTVEWYRAEVLLAPTTDNSQGLTDRLGGLGGLAGLAGLSMGGSERAESIAVLKSRDLTRDFINDHDLITVLLHEQWDESAGRWKAVNAAEQPDMRDAIKFFHENVLSVTDNAQNGLVTVGIEWTDPHTAASWASDLVALVNLHMRGRALAEAEENIEYLEEQLTETSVATLRESIGSLIESELQKLMLAQGNAEFAFRVVDSAQIPKERVRPKRALIVILGAIVGGAIAVFVVFVRHSVKRGRSRSPKAESI